MFYIVYKTTNQVNGKFYIGTHKTVDLNDDYLGSGKLLKRAIEKYGAVNFKKEILFVFDNPKEMFAKETEIVTEEFLSEHNTYNLKKGGFGGFDYINEKALGNKSLAGKKGREKTNKILFQKYGENWPSILSKITKNYEKGLDVVRKKYPNGTFLGKKHTKKTKKIIGEKNSIHQTGSGNSQYGTCWITDGKQNKKIKITENIPEGFIRGRSHGERQLSQHPFKVQ